MAQARRHRCYRLCHPAKRKVCQRRAGASLCRSLQPHRRQRQCRDGLRHQLAERALQRQRAHRAARPLHQRCQRQGQLLSLHGLHDPRGYRRRKLRTVELRPSDAALQHQLHAVRLLKRAQLPQQARPWCQRRLHACTQHWYRGQLHLGLAARISTVSLTDLARHHHQTGCRRSHGETI